MPAGLAIEDIFRAFQTGVPCLAHGFVILIQNSGEQCAHFSRMSNARLVAEMLSAKAYMNEARATREAGITGGKANWLNDTVMVAVDYIELELTRRIDALEYGRNDVYNQRAMASDTAILTQYANNYRGLAAPPADPRQ